MAIHPCSFARRPKRESTPPTMEEVILSRIIEGAIPHPSHEHTNCLLVRITNPATGQKVPVSGVNLVERGLSRKPARSRSV